jgi:hypothetical protein
MPVQIDEMQANVVAEHSRQSEESSSASQSQKEPMEKLRYELRRLKSRELRLNAD